MASFVLCTSYAAQSTDYRWDVNTAAEFRMALNASRASRLLCNTTLVGKETLQYVRRVSVVATSARTAEGSLAVNDDVAAEASILEQGRHAGQKRFRKVNVALHVGYVGTSYTGLQANRELPELATIEGVLEKAILDAGLIKADNYGDFRKTKWTRSSRTDKGVHSLCTVIGLRIMVDEEAYISDPEGIGYARAINEHLPSDIRVFCVQRTNKSFNARRWCGSRTYEYYLPAAALELETPDGSSSSDQQKLEVVREVLQQYCGYKPFHNYAGNRRQYVGQKAKAARRRERRAARLAAESAAETSDASQDETYTDPVLWQQQQQQQDKLLASSNSSSSVAPADAAGTSEACNPAAAAKQTSISSSTAEDSESEALGEGELDPVEQQQYEAAAASYDYSGKGPVPEELLWQQQVRFLTTPDPDDPVVKSHYRMIRSFTADDPRPLVPGGVPCLRLEVCGDSFMLHQIRHMVGAAVAIARGIMPRELLEVSLSAPGRVTLPRAPPHTLLLSGSLFSPFPKGWGHEVALVAQWTGERLMIRDNGKQELLGFRQQVFDPALNQLLLHPDWDTWSRKMLPRYKYAADEAQPAAEAHAAWFAELKAKRAAEAAARAAEKEAAANAAEREAAAGAPAAADASNTTQQASEAAAGKPTCCVQ